MIKMPREVGEVVKKIKNEGYDIYAVGGCVRDALSGDRPVDWDLATNAPIEAMLKIYPNAAILSEELNVVRLDFTKSADDEKSPIVDIARFRREEVLDERGKPVKFQFVENIEEDLARRDFTVNAMADNPYRNTVDIYDSKSDLKNRIIRTVGDPNERFAQDPIRMLRAVRFVAERDYTIDEESLSAIKKNAMLLKSASKDKIREEFARIMGGRWASKAISILVDTNLISNIAGENAGIFPFKKRALYLRMLRNIDRTYPIAIRRLALFYNLLGPIKGQKAIDMLNYDKNTKRRLYDAVFTVQKVSIINKDVELKEFLSEYGYERYEHIDELLQDKIVVYGGSARRVNKRKKIADKIQEKNEPVLTSHLMIGGDELIEEGISPHLIGDILKCLLLEVHRAPFKNNRATLLHMAKSFSKSGIKRKIRLNKWLNRLR